MKSIKNVNRILVSLGFMILCFAITTLGVRSAPINGSWSDYAEIESKVWSQTKRFRGGERAAVLAIGDHEEAGVKLRIAVYDAQGALIAEDKGESDFVGVIWYPPRDEDYRIDVSHTGAAANKVYIAVK